MRSLVARKVAAHVLPLVAVVIMHLELLVW